MLTTPTPTDEEIHDSRQLSRAAQSWCEDIAEQLPGYPCRREDLPSTRSTRGGKNLFRALAVQFGNAAFLAHVPVAS